MQDKTFLRAAALAALGTVFTTLGVHFISFQADDFQQRLLLARDPMYIFQKWLVVLHCSLVLVSMQGAALLVEERSRGLARLGMFSFGVFAVMEIARMLTVLFYLNGLREKYLGTTDPALQQFLAYDLGNWSLISQTMFAMFILAFMLGNLCYGLGLLRRGTAPTDDLRMGGVFLLWALLTGLAFGNDLWQNAGIGTLVDLNNKYFQPAFRLAIAWWLWRKA
jgi:hypothetical protein